MSDGTRAALLPDLLRARAGADPDAVALRVGDTGALTLGDWERRSNAAARGLVDRGVRPGDLVALLFADDDLVEYAVGYLAVLKAGAVAVPVGRRFAGRQLDHILHATDVVGVLSGAGVPPPSTTGWRAGSAALERGQAGDRYQVEVEATALAEVIYTSGTTGMAQGVTCTHANLMAHDVAPDAATTDGVVSFLHCFPIGTQAAQEAMRVPLRVANRVAVALPVFDPALLCALVARHRIARLQLVPALAQMLVSSDAPRHHDLSSVRRVILSSAHAPPSLFARLAGIFPAATLWNAYALTEAGGARTLMQFDVRRPSSVGLPVGETELRIVGETGDDLGTGEVGEVWLRRRATPTRGYHRDPVATAAVFVDGWVRSGDLGHLDADGYLHLDDRLKDLIISGGLNISSVEVEDALCEHPAVVEAAVFGVAHAVLGEQVAAAVVAGPGTTERDLRDFVRARLAEHQVPRRLVLVDELPRNASGKVRKTELRLRHGGEEPAAPSVPPAGPIEEAVAAVWTELLGVPVVGAHDDFFALGGHSLVAVQIIARLGETFGIELDAGAVFESPTVAELAAALTSARAAAAPES